MLPELLAINYSGASHLPGCKRKAINEDYILARKRKKKSKTKSKTYLKRSTAAVDVKDLFNQNKPENIKSMPEEKGLFLF